MDRKSKKSKKISLGQIVTKTVDILKKPFTRNKSKTLTKVVKLKEKKRKKAPQTSDELLKLSKLQKPKRKKETILVDYPKNSIAPLSLKDDEDEIFLQKRKKSKREAKLLDDELLQKNSLDGEDPGIRTSLQQLNSEVNGFFYVNDKFLIAFEDQDILLYLKKFYPSFMKDPLDFQTLKKQILDMLLNALFMEDFLNYYDINIYDFFKFLFRIEPDLFRGSFLKRILKAMRYKKYAIKAKKCSHSERRRARLKALKCKN